MKIKATSLCACIILGSSLSSYGLVNTSIKEYVKKLDKEVVDYQCPTVDHKLSAELQASSISKKMTQEICSKNPEPKECLSGPLSLPNEEIGLSNITKMGDKSTCQMAQEDINQLNWYYSTYLRSSKSERAIQYKSRDGNVSIYIVNGLADQYVSKVLIKNGSCQILRYGGPLFGKINEKFSINWANFGWKTRKSETLNGTISNSATEPPGATISWTKLEGNNCNIPAEQIVNLYPS